MYKLHLILKYLRKRRIAWVSLIAVMLCTAMVLIVISVMGGWLRMFRESFRGLSGDIIVQGQSLTGFPHYGQMIGRIEQLEGINSAVPTIRTFGLINISGQIRQPVEVMGYPAENISDLKRFHESLYRQYQQPIEQGQSPPTPSFDLLPDMPYERILPKARNVRNWPGMIVGAGVVGIGKNKEGVVDRNHDIHYQAWARLEVMGISDEVQSLSSITPTPNNYWIVDDSRTQLWQFDSGTVYVPFDVLQRDLSMQASADAPARTSEIQINLKSGADPMQARNNIQSIVDEVTSNQGVSSAYSIRVVTWEESQKKFLGAIENEVALVTFLFGIISLVAVFLIFCIFYMIVVEKTKDIGVIKSVGATSGGVAGIFLGYGLAIGIVGSGLGFLAAYLIVSNINYLHAQMGKLMGIQIWNPEVYAFDTIPNTMEPRKVVIILAVAIISSLFGALLPAMRAARMNPVEALRWE